VSGRPLLAAVGQVVRDETCVVERKESTRSAE
jgi:hypothetical protein